MTDIVNCIQQLFKKSLNTRLVLFLAGSLLSFLVLVIALVLLTATVLGITSHFLAQGSPTVFLAVSALVLLVATLLFLVLSAIFEGFLFHFSRDQLDGQSLSVSRSWSQIKPRLKTVFLQQTLVSFVVLLVVGLVCLPLLSATYTFIQSPEGGLALVAALEPSMLTDDAQLISQTISQGVTLYLQQNGALLGLTLAVLAILSILFLPFLLLFKTIPYFEHVRVGESIRLAWVRSNKHFVFNWLFFVLFLISMIVLTLIVDTLINSIVSLAGISSGAGILLFVFLIGTLMAQSYYTALSTLFSVIVYEQNDPVSHFPSTPHAETVPLVLPKDDKPKRPTYRKTVKRKSSR